MLENLHEWWNQSRVRRPMATGVLIAGTGLMLIGLGPIGLALILSATAVLLAEFEHVLCQRPTRRRR